MPAASLADAFIMGIEILKTTLTETTKKIVAQIGTVNGDGQTDADNVDWVQHVGFASRPAKAEPGKEAAQGFGIRRGGRDVIFASQDLRGLEIYGNLKDGETAIYAVGEDGEGQARALFKKDGSVTLYSRKGNTASGAGMMIGIDAMGGAIRLVNDQGYGIIIDGDGVSITAKGAALILKSGGDCSLIGKGKCQIDGGGICIGSMAVPGVNSAITGVTGIAGKASLKVLIE